MMSDDVIRTGVGEYSVSVDALMRDGAVTYTPPEEEPEKGQEEWILYCGRGSGTVGVVAEVADETKWYLAGGDGVALTTEQYEGEITKLSINTSALPAELVAAQSLLAEKDAEIERLRLQHLEFVAWSQRAIALLAEQNAEIGRLRHDAECWQRLSADIIRLRNVPNANANLLITPDLIDHKLGGDKWR
jgi:hypothetical protein